MNCTHNEVDLATRMCQTCGQIMDTTHSLQENTIHVNRTKKKPDFFTAEEIRNLGLSENIIRSAENISEQMFSIKSNRSDKKRQRKFTCIFTALREADENFNPDEIAAALGLSLRKKSGALANFSANRSGYEQKAYIPPAHASVRLCSNYCISLNIPEDAFHLIKRMIEKTLNVNQTFRHRKPATIAGAGICAYLQINPSDHVDLAAISRVCGISENTIKTAAASVLAAYSED